MEQTIEIMLDQLVANEQFLQVYEAGSRGIYGRSTPRDLALTPFEVRALLSTDADVFERFAQELDSRLRKDRLHS